MGLEFEESNKPKLWYQPPGYVIPIVWFVLFTLLAEARANVLHSGQPQLQWWLFALAVLCATYAYYTLGLAKWSGISALWYGLFGNMAVIFFAAMVVCKLYPASPAAAYLTLPVIIWTAFASLIVWGEMKIEKSL